MSNVGQALPSTAEHRDILYFLAHSFREYLVRELPPTKDTLNAEKQKLVYVAKGLLKELAQISFEIAQSVIGGADGITLETATAPGVASDRLESISSETEKISLAAQARKWFVTSYPFLGALAEGFALIEDPRMVAELDVRLAAISKFYKKIYVVHDNLTLEEWKFVIAHEALHVGLRYFSREQGRPHSDELLSVDDFCRRVSISWPAYFGEKRCRNPPQARVNKIRSLSNPPIPWEVELDHWFDENFVTPYRCRTYAHLSRRQRATPDISIPRSFIHADELSEPRTFGLVIDTSGSVLQPALLFLQTAENFPKDTPILVITDGFCDDFRTSRQHAVLISPNGKAPNSGGAIFRMGDS